MTSHDRVIASKELKSLARFFNRRPDLDDDTIADYLDALEDLTFDSFELAIRTCKRDGKWFPKPRDLRIAASDAQAEGRPRWQPTPYVTTPEGEVVPTFCCRRCEDTGWAPACGCALSDLGVLATVGECATHPRIVHDKAYRQALMACGCRDGNPAYQAKVQRPEAPRADRQRGAM